MLALKLKNNYNIHGFEFEDMTKEIKNLRYATIQLTLYQRLKTVEMFWVMQDQNLI